MSSMDVAGESSVRWHFLSSNNSVGKLCVSWALPFIEYVAVWALKLPVVSAPLRSLHNRSPPDFLQLIPTYSKPTSHKVVLLFYWNPKRLATVLIPPHLTKVFDNLAKVFNSVRLVRKKCSITAFIKHFFY